MLGFLKRRVFLVVVGLVLVALFIWIAGPFVAFADWYPLAPALNRVIAIALVIAGWALMAWLKRRKAARAGDQLAAAVVKQAQTDGRPVGRRHAASRAVRGSGRGAQAEEGRPPEPVRPAVVRDHRRPGIGQDDGACQFRPAFSARAAHRQGRAARRRRHAQLRLVVYRRGGVPRHRGPLHDAGLRCQRRQRGLARVPRAALQVPQAPSGQRRPGRDQRARPDGAGPGGA